MGREVCGRGRRKARKPKGYQKKNISTTNIGGNPGKKTGEYSKGKGKRREGAASLYYFH